MAIGLRKVEALVAVRRDGNGRDAKIRLAALKGIERRTLCAATSLLFGKLNHAI